MIICKDIPYLKNKNKVKKKKKKKSVTLHS